MQTSRKHWKIQYSQRDFHCCCLDLHRGQTVVLWWFSVPCNPLVTLPLIYPQQQQSVQRGDAFPSGPNQRNSYRHTSRFIGQGKVEASVSTELQVMRWRWLIVSCDQALNTKHYSFWPLLISLVNGSWITGLHTLSQTPRVKQSLKGTHA